MNYKYIYVILVSLIIVGCQTTYIKEPVVVYSKPLQLDNIPIKTDNKPSFVYNPNGKEQFIFHEKVKSLQKYGYDDFCFSTKSISCFEDRLPYETYVGMKGYFDTELPTKVDSSGYEFHPVVLENGRNLYFVSNKKYGGKYGSSSPIISLKLYQEIKSFKAEPLIPTSNIQVVSKKIMHNNEFYILSNGENILSNKLKLIREVANRFGNDPKIAELLLGLKIEKDEVDYRFFISPIGTSLGSEAKLYIGFNDKEEWLRFKVKYYADDWLFVSSYKVAADDYRWQSPKITFKRDNSGSNIWEWSDVPATAEYIEVAKALSESTKSTIRFQGSKYYSDKHLTNVQKEELKKILKLYALMKSA